MGKIVVGFDVSPLFSGHRVRGIGFYTRYLLEELKKIKNLQLNELRTKEEIAKANYDLLHVPYFHPYFFSLPLRKKRPLIVTVHDLISLKYRRHYPPGLRGWLRWQVQKRFLHRADFVITDSFAAKDDIHRLLGYPRDKIYVIYLAAGRKFRPVKNTSRLAKLKQKYHLPSKFILYVGDVNWNKNLPALVKAARLLSLPLVIVGQQAVAKEFDRRHPENASLVWLQQKIDGKRIIAPGFVPDEDLVAFYNLAAVYCQPSFDEGFGLPVLEAMACGCPVVSSRCGSLPEVVGDAGVLTEPTAPALAKGIKQILTEKKLRQQLVQLGRQQAATFSWQRTARETFRLYRLLWLQSHRDSNQKSV